MKRKQPRKWMGGKSKAVGGKMKSHAGCKNV